MPKEEQSLPPAKMEPQLPVEPEIIHPAMTPAQAKVDAIANLTFKAYEKASTLMISETELELLQAEFPDDAFRLGAGGDMNLIYIEHAHLRDRLNKVFKAGQWAIVPRNRWSENFTTAKGEPASRVYVEAMLLIRGCFVAEAIGDMVYYPNNAKQNYGDAVEGAKSACLRRCAKELGVGLQAWKKQFCEGWKQRNASGTAPTPPRPAAPAAPAKATEKHRAAMIQRLMNNGISAKEIQEYAVKSSIILSTEQADMDWPLDKCPTNPEQMAAILKAAKAFVDGGDVIP